ncbi:MAG: tRNA glutamyl-Q(34) synthetase GluQRS, partial [Methylococcales bacterium]|nr:tRNA glutamyl-Q(34) synthetase GluQRS [Methylococcales bacterium]
MSFSHYIGRFAPSPSGPLHLGSLYTALASFLHAKAHQGQWILRIDDLDTPRNVSGATECIIETLQHYGLYWQGDIQFQSDRLDHYEKIIALLRQQQLAYPCSCSRKQLAG